MPIITQNWDGTVTGWTVDGTLSATTPPAGITAPSSPNVLKTTSTANSVRFATYGTQDGNSGNVVASARFATTNLSGTKKCIGGVTARGSAATLDTTSTTFYHGYFDLDGAVAGIDRYVAGTQTILAQQAVTGTIAIDILYLVELAPLGSTPTGLSLTVIRQSDGFYLNSGGAWQSGAAVAITYSDTSPITGQGYAGVTLQCTLGTLCTDDFELDGAVIPITLYAADLGTSSETSSLAKMIGDVTTGLESAYRTATLTTADAGTPAESWLHAAIGGDAGTTAECPLSHPLGGDSGTILDVSLAYLPAGDASTPDSTSLATSLGGDLGSVIEASLTSTFAGGFIYAADGASFDDSATLLISLAGDSSTDVEAFASNQLIVAADGASFDDSAVLSILATSAGYTSTDGASGTESAPAPTAWATDTAAADADQVATSLGGDSGSGGTGGSLDLATGSEAWSLASVIIACDRGYPDSAWSRAALIFGLDAATADELAAVGLLTVGYHVYMSPAINQPIDYSTVVATILGFDNTTWTSSTLAVPGAWGFGVRAFNDAGEERNLDCSVYITLNSAGIDISNIPPAPVGLRAVPVKGAQITVIWATGIAPSPTKKPTQFFVYMTAGSTVSYVTPSATVNANTSIAGTYQATLSGVNGVSYTIGVRAVNASGTEQNQNVVTCVADGVGPTAVSGLSMTLIP